jgi:hypothetical protein
MGRVLGLPYTVHDDEKMRLNTLYFFIASSRFRVPIWYEIKSLKETRI